MALLCLLVSAPAAAQETEDSLARDHFAAARAYFEEGAYDRALDEFQRAWDLSHRAPLLLNLAMVNERLARYDQAIANIRQYLQLMPNAPDRAVLERRVENLERLRGSQPQQVATTTTAPAGGGGGPDSGLLIGSLVGYGVGGVGAVFMVLFGSLALAENGTLASGCGATASCTLDQVANANTFALISDIGLVAALAGAATGTVLLILSLTSGGGGDRRAAIVPWLTPNALGLTAMGAF